MKVKEQVLITIITTIVILIFLLATKVSALSIPMSINKTSATVGDSFSITISGINGRVDISTSGPITLNQKGSIWIDGSITISGTCTGVGTGKVSAVPHTDKTVTTTSADAEFVTGGNSKSITINPKPTPTPEQTKKVENNNTSKTTTTQKTQTTQTTKKEENKQQEEIYIDSIGLKGVKEDNSMVVFSLEPEFSKNTYEYTVTVPNDVIKIEVEKYAGEYTKNIIVDVPEELKEGENIITLKLSVEDQKQKIYTIKVIKEEEKETEEIVETIGTLDSNENTDNAKMLPVVSMPVWVFVILELGIIVLEALIIKFIPWSKIFKFSK